MRDALGSEIAARGAGNRGCGQREENVCGKGNAIMITKLVLNDKTVSSESLLQRMERLAGGRLKRKVHEARIWLRGQCGT